MAASAQSTKHEFPSFLSGDEPAATQIPASEVRIPLPVYIPVNVYVPLFCMMTESSAERPSGVGGATSPLATGSITYTVNGAAITWIPTK
jgi:hypothetical protein